VKKIAIMFTLFYLLTPAAAFPFDADKPTYNIEKTTYDLTHKWIPWREKVRIIDDLSPLRDEKVLETLITIYNDGSLNFGCPAILYHTVNGMRYFRGNKKAIRTVRDGIHYDEPEIRMISLEVLGVIGSEEDIDYLKPFLKSKSSFESHYAQIAIEKIRQRKGRRDAMSDRL